MKTLILFGYFAVIIVFISPLYLKAEEGHPTPQSDFFICKNLKNIRTLRLEKTQGECRTIYTKAGKDRVIGQGQFEESCFKFLSNVKSNLEKAGWNCKEAPKTQVTYAQ